MIKGRYPLRITSVLLRPLSLCALLVEDDGMDEVDGGDVLVYRDSAGVEDAGDALLFARGGLEDGAWYGEGGGWGCGR